MNPDRPFVFANQTITTDLGDVIEVNDVGLWKSVTGSHSTVFFINAWRDNTIKTSLVTSFDERETGDAFPKKICNVCNKLKNTAEFARNQNGVNNRPVRRPTCQSCRENMEGVNMDRVERRKWDKIKPHRTPFECPICSKRTIAGVTSKMVLEHDHLTGKIRGWVCDSCNTGLGRFKDNRTLLERAIKFLEA